MSMGPRLYAMQSGFAKASLRTVLANAGEAAQQVKLYTRTQDLFRGKGVNTVLFKPSQNRRMPALD